MYITNFREGWSHLGGTKVLVVKAIMTFQENSNTTNNDHDYVIVMIIQESLTTHKMELHFSCAWVLKLLKQKKGKTNKAQLSQMQTPDTKLHAYKEKASQN